MSIDGVIVASRDVPSTGTEYTVRRDDGSEQVFWAGPTDASLPRSMPVGTRIRKEPWHLDYERDGRRESFPWIFYSSVLGIALSLLVWGTLTLRSQPPNPLHENNWRWLSGPLMCLRSGRRLLSILLEGAAVTLFGAGLVSTQLFLASEPRAKLLHRRTKIPNECEAAYYSHGIYACWYTIQDHPFWFALSLGAIATGVGIIAWSQSHWFPRRKTGT